RHAVRPGGRGDRRRPRAGPGAGACRCGRDARRADPLGGAPPAPGGGEGAVRRALISVYDKRGLPEFAAGLVELGWELVASGGTASLLEKHWLPLTYGEKMTGFAEMLGHRVVPLPPAVHGGILARRDVPEDLDDLAEHQIEPIDMVVVNLYPFTEVASQRGVTEEEAVEMIDIGGPTLLRAAAK